MTPPKHVRETGVVVGVGIDPSAIGEPIAVLDPALAVQVQVAPVSAAGKLSVTVAPVAVDGPVFAATSV